MQSCAELRKFQTSRMLAGVIAVVVGGAAYGWLTYTGWLWAALGYSTMTDLLDFFLYVS